MVEVRLHQDAQEWCFHMDWMRPVTSAIRSYTASAFYAVDKKCAALVVSTGRRRHSAQLARYEQASELRRDWKIQRVWWLAFEECVAYEREVWKIDRRSDWLAHKRVSKKDKDELRKLAASFVPEGVRRKRERERREFYGSIKEQEAQLSSAMRLHRNINRLLTEMEGKR
jgi:hypothetical protein